MSMYKVKELCKKCGKPMVMYYRVYCPRCEKPKLKTTEYYNLLECLYYVEATSHPGFTDKCWEYLVSKYDFANNSMVCIGNDPYDPNPLIQELFEKMGIEDESMEFELSW